MKNTSEKYSNEDHNDEIIDIAWTITILGIALYMIFIFPNKLTKPNTLVDFPEEITAEEETFLNQLDTVSVNANLSPQERRSIAYNKLAQMYSTLGIKFAHIVIAQSIQETGHFRSKIYKLNKNGFGMKANYRGYCKYTPKQKDICDCYDCEHACYNDMWDSVLDQVAWQFYRMSAYHQKYGRIQTSSDYFHFLDHIVINGKDYRYAEDKNYTNKLREIIKYYNLKPVVATEK